MKRIVLAGVALALLAGCGNAASDTGDNTNRRAEVLSELGIYQDAFLAEDAAAACDRLTGDAKRNIVSELAAVAKDGLSCESVLEGAMGLFGPDDYAEVEKAREELGPADVQLQGPDKAVVALPSGRTTEMARIEGAWYVDETGDSDDAQP